MQEASCFILPLAIVESAILASNNKPIPYLESVS